MAIKPIRTASDYERALRHIETLWDSPEGSEGSDELDVLATLVEAYEREHFPIDSPNPIDAILFRLEQSGKDSRALIGVIGGRSRVHEVLHGKRLLSINMIRALHKKFDIPADLLISAPHNKSARPQRRQASRHTRTSRAAKHRRRTAS